MMDDYSPEEIEFAAKLGKTLVDKIDETELYIIKCHLLVEYALNHYIEQISEKRLDLSKIGFSFSQKVKICTLLGLFNSEFGNNFKSFIIDLNKIL